MGEEKSIRALTDADAEALSALHGTSFPAPWPAADFAALLTSAGVVGWGVIHKNEMDAFILVRAVADESEILTLAVRPDLRRRGLAAQLLTQALAWLTAHEIARVFLEVAADNAAALALYGNAGFTPCGRRSGYYGQGTTDAVVMMLALPATRLSGGG